MNEQAIHRSPRRIAASGRRLRTATRRDVVRAKCPFSFPSVTGFASVGGLPRHWRCTRWLHRDALRVGMEGVRRHLHWHSQCHSRTPARKNSPKSGCLESRESRSLDSVDEEKITTKETKLPEVRRSRFPDGQMLTSKNRGRAGQITRSSVVHRAAQRAHHRHSSSGTGSASARW